MLAISSILHPTDFSESSAAAFRLACALARDYAARLVILYVYPPPFNGADAVDRGRPGGLEDDMSVKLHELKPHDPGIKVEYRAEEGNPAEEILAVAEEEGNDLIVMGTRSVGYRQGTDGERGRVGQSASDAPSGHSPPRGPHSARADRVPYQVNPGRDTRRSLNIGLDSLPVPGPHGPRMSW